MVKVGIARHKHGRGKCIVHMAIVANMYYLVGLKKFVIIFWSDWFISVILTLVNHFAKHVLIVNCSYIECH